MFASLYRSSVILVHLGLFKIILRALLISPSESITIAFLCAYVCIEKIFGAENMVGAFY